jgi:hypothetical protein
MEEQLDQITQVPHCEVTPNETGYALTCKGLTIQLRKAMREDLLKAQRKNAANKPYMTNIYLLRLIASEADADAAEKDTQTLFGILSALEQVKNKTSIAVKKL